MFLKDEITDEYRTKFEKLNITDIDEMLSILNGFDYIAELAYSSYKNNREKNEADDKEKD